MQAYPQTNSAAPGQSPLKAPFEIYNFYFLLVTERYAAIGPARLPTHLPMCTLSGEARPGSASYQTRP
eukprot:4615394-Pyramimonas_sp.AAC.1